MSHFFIALFGAIILTIGFKNSSDVVILSGVLIQGAAWIGYQCSKREY